MMEIMSKMRTDQEEVENLEHSSTATFTSVDSLDSDHELTSPPFFSMVLLLMMMMGDRIGVLVTIVSRMLDTKLI